MTAAQPFAVLFDLDGTLLDSIGLLLDCMEHAFTGRAVIPSRAAWTAGIGTPLRDQMRGFGVAEHELEAVVARYRMHQDEHLERRTSLFPGARESVEALRASGVPVGVVTSKGRGMTERSLVHVGMLELFDVLVTATDTVRHKPDPLPVQHALAQLGVAPHRALFVGDSTHDMNAGRAAGTFTGAALWGPFSREQLAVTQPTHWLQELPQVTQLVAQLAELPPRIA
jgi:pyrophosphatase PpaX